MLRVFIVVFALALVGTLSACDQGKPTTPVSSAGSSAVPSALPAGIFLTAAPANPKDIKDAKPTLKAGDKVVLVGRIGGSDEPFVAERAIFTLVDRRLKACGEGTAMDTCKTPWDYCCEAREDITANSATVRVVGADGQPIKAELNGVKGLKPLATVTVVGTVATAEGENVVVTRHKLWPVTMALLAQHQRVEAAPSDRWFVSDGGGALVWEKLVDGQLKKTDSIKNAFWRIQRETGINGARGFYCLRKTAATEIEKIDPLVTSMFLGHSPKEMKRFYALRNWDSLDRAVAQMGERFKFLSTAGTAT